MMKRAVVIAFAGVLAAAAVLRQEDERASKGRALLDAAVQALGGQAFLSARDSRSEGRAYQFNRFEELSGLAKFVEYEKFPDKVRQELGKDKDIIVVYNGDKGWEKAFRGVREMNEEEMKRVRENRLMGVENILRFRLKEPGLQVRFMNSDVIGGKPVDWVEVTDAENRAVSIAIEQSTKFPVRREWTRRNPQTHVREDEVEILGNYQKDGAIMTPHYVLRERDRQKMFEVFLTDTTYNVNPPDSLFQRPPGPERLDPRRKRK